MAAERKTAWVDAYVERSAQRTAARDKPHLHQTAGWYDIPRIEDWHAYVADVVSGHLTPAVRVFEAGCGVLAFLAEVRRLEPSAALHGVDGSEASIRVIREELAGALGVDPAAFRVGLVPDALAAERDGAYDLTLCNSVLQYVPRADAFRTVDEMLRITRPGGTAIVADVCDEAFRAEEEPKLAGFWQGYGDALPAYTYFDARDWSRYDEQASVTIRRTSVASYRRRRSRYLVYLTKRC